MDDPNPTRGKVPILDRIKAIFCIATAIPISLFQVSWRCFRGINNLSFKDDFIRTLLRSAASIPRSVKRKILIPNESEIVNANRFKNVAHLCEKVVTDEFVGYWICKPESYDAVVLWFYGGGYTIGHPLTNAVTLLRVSELVGNVAIFSLDYSCAPEAKFPRQQQQALAAFRYLQPARIIVAGQSAGGNLALSLIDLVDVDAAWLMCPWVDLTNSGSSFERNKYNDALSKTNLDESVQLFGSKKRFTKLPPYTWITIGTYDLLLDDVVDFVRNSTTEVDLVLKDNQPHAWESMSDHQDEKKYSRLQPNDDVGDLMKGAGFISQGLKECMKRVVKNDR